MTVFSRILPIFNGSMSHGLKEPSGSTESIVMPAEHPFEKKAAPAWIRP
jgi:hypothetical protein